MNITFYLVLMLGILLAVTNKKYGKIQDNVQYVNYVILVLLMILSGYSMTALSWMIMHTDNMIKYFEDFEYMPQWLNLTMWIISQVSDFILIILIFYMARRKEIARVYLLKLLPIISVSLLYNSVRESYELFAKTETSIFINIGMLFSVGVVPFLLIYYFYSREDVKEKLFIKEDL